MVCKELLVTGSGDIIYTISLLTGDAFFMHFPNL